LNDEQYRALAEEQAALRRVATLVAQGTPPDDLLAAVTREVGLLLGAHLAGMGRYEADDTVTVLATWAAEGEGHPLVPGPWPLEGGDLASTVFWTGQSVWIDDYQGVPGRIAAFVRDDLGIGSSIAGPITVEGRLWGVLFLHAKQSHPPFSRDAVSRLTDFTELVAAAIANAESRAELARLAEEQAALGRVATLVASGVAQDEVFAAVTEEIGQLLPVDVVNLCHYETDGTVTFVAIWGRSEGFPVGSRWPLRGRNMCTLVFETRGPARIDNFADTSGSLSVTARDSGLRSAVACPIIVDSRLWGMIGVATHVEEPLPPDTEAHLAALTELVAMAVANAESRAELVASRARIVAAADESRRRIERDLHDGTQQQLVSLMLEIRAAELSLPRDPSDLQAQLERTRRSLDGVLETLRETSRGIHPAILSKAGLGPALRTLARRSAVPVELDLRAERRLPEHIEMAAYYVISEALANTAKHALASMVTIQLDAQDVLLRLVISDDGIGGADPAQGSGLIGLVDRIEALGGRIDIASPARKGTSLSIEIPVEHQNIGDLA
jgi:signal transduction histidine kinase